MAKDIRYKNNPAIQSLYAWFPDAFADDSKYKFQTPKDIYVNLGSRPPLPKSNTEMDTIKQYHQEMIDNKMMNLSLKVDPDVNVRPPWALCHLPSPNKPQNIEERKKRVKSAYPRLPAPSDRIVLQIPAPQLKNLFNDETNTAKSADQNNNATVRPKTSQTDRPPTDVSYGNTDDSLNLNVTEPILDKIHISNAGKTPIIDSNTLVKEILIDKKKMLNKAKKLNRPKTAIASATINTLEDDLRIAGIQSTNNNIAQLNKSNTVTRSKSCISSRRTPLNQPDLNNNIQTNYTATQCLNESYFDPINKELIKKGHWKDDLLNRGCYVHVRPPYFTKIDLEKIKAYPMLKDIHYKASETYFYNTIPVKKTTFVVNPNFVSENMTQRKYERYGPNNEIKFSRDYAFVY